MKIKSEYAKIDWQNPPPNSLTRGFVFADDQIACRVLLLHRRRRRDGIRGHAVVPRDPQPCPRGAGAPGAAEGAPAACGA